MKFEKFQAIREKMIQEGSLNESVRSFREYKELFVEAANDFEAEEIVNSIEESDIDILGLAAFEDSQLDEKDSGSNIFKNIFGWMKIKGLSSKYMKSMVDEAIQDMDYARRKKASDSSEETEQLRTAHTAKKDALKDRTKAIGEKIDAIATTDFLKKVASKTKITARMKKNEIVIKIASKEEAKELKLKNQELTGELQSIDAELREYEKENQEGIKDAKKEAAEKIKGEIQKIEDKISAVQKSITDKEDELSSVGESATFEAEGDPAPADPAADDAAKKQKAEAKGKIYAELAKLKADKAKLKSEQLDKKKAYNEAIGKEEYDLKNAEDEINTLVSNAKEYEKKANDAGVKIEDTPAEGPKGGEAASGPAEPAASGPAEPAASGPAEPAASGPAEPAASGPAEPAASGPAEPAASGPAEPAASGPAEPAASGPAEPAASGPAEPAASGPAEPEESEVDKAKKEGWTAGEPKPEEADQYEVKTAKDKDGNEVKLMKKKEAPKESKSLKAAKSTMTFEEFRASRAGK